MISVTDLGHNNGPLAAFCQVVQARLGFGIPVLLFTTAAFSVTFF
jgi:hypothetical protein